jgi:hypothetical protein
MIRYTPKVRDIMHFIEQYGFLTTKICGSLFYKDNKFPIDQSRRVLNRLVANKDIVCHKDKYGKELIYQFKKEVVSDHNYYLLNLYAEINSIVTQVDYFKLETTWSRTNRRSDAHLIFHNRINGKDLGKGYLIEFDKYHKTNPKEKYGQIYDSEEIQDWYKENYGFENYFPDVLVVNYSGKCVKSDRNEFNIIGLDYNFTDLVQKVIL